MSVDEPIELADVRRLVVGPEETLVVTLHRDATADHIDHVSRVIRDELPDGTRCIVMRDGDVQLTVVKSLGSVTA